MFKFHCSVLCFMLKHYQMPFSIWPVSERSKFSLYTVVGRPLRNVNAFVLVSLLFFHIILGISFDKSHESVEETDL